MRSKRSWLKLMIALMALGIAFWMNSIYDKNLISASAPAEDTSFLKEFTTYSYADINRLCDNAIKNKTLQKQDVVLDFAPPAPTEERQTNCPWSRGDNLAPRAGQLMSRYEQLRVASLPEKAIICSLSIKMDTGQSPLEYQDFYVLALNGIILSTDAEFLFKLFREEKTQISESREVRSYLYDWSRVLGARRPATLSESDDREYCIGRDITLSNCNFSKTNEAYFQFNDRLAQWLAARGTGPNQRFTMIVTGDKDEKEDCAHSGFKLKATYGYVIN